MFRRMRRQPPRRHPAREGLPLIGTRHRWVPENHRDTGEVRYQIESIIAGWPNLVNTEPLSDALDLVLDLCQVLDEDRAEYARRIAESEIRIGRFHESRYNALRGMIGNLLDTEETYTALYERATTEPESVPWYVLRDGYETIRIIRERVSAFIGRPVHRGEGGS